MLRATIKSLLAHKVRMGLSAFAIVLGVAFVAGSFIFSDTLSKSFSDIFRDTSPDVTVRPERIGNIAFTGDARTLPASLVDDLESVSGVARADGSVENTGTFVIGSNGKVVSTGGAPGLAFNWNDAPAADGTPPLTIVEGREPRGDGEVLIDVKTADRAGYEIGDRIRLVTTSSEAPTIEATLVGVVRFGETGNLVGASLAIFETAAAQRLFLGGEDAFHTIAVTAADGVTNERLRDDVAAELPNGTEALTATEIADEAQDSLQESLQFINVFLLVFAAVALVVGTFLIINTFSILVAQRTRELALLRSLGASRRQITTSVLLEALVVGLVGSTIGLALGFLLALGIKALFAAIGLDLSSAGLVFQPRTLVAAYAVGVVVTLLAAYFPARRAARVPPVAAMRDDVALPESSMRLRMIAGGVLAALGAVAMAYALFGGGSLSVLGIGVLLVFIGVSLLSPALSRPIVAALGAGYPKLFGPVGRLARENAKRNPRRTAATASALMVGMALVAAMSVLGQSAKDSVDAAVEQGLRADFIVSNAVQAPFSTAIAGQLAQVEGVDEVAAYRFAFVRRGDSDAFVSAFEPRAMSRMIQFDAADGDLDALDSRGVLVSETGADSGGWSVGDTVTFTFPSGDRALTVVGIFEPSPLIGSDFVVHPDALDEGGIPPADYALYITQQAGADPAGVRGALDAALADLPTVTLKDREEFADEQRGFVDQLLSIIYALLGLAIVIAVLGIVNTLALSVIERTREVGLLRAVGMSRRQLRTMVRLESIVIALLGSVLGVILGLIFGLSLIRSLRDQGLSELGIPWVQLVVFLLLSILVGVLAAVWPARRAARLDVLRAITTD